MSQNKARPKNRSNSKRPSAGREESKMVRLLDQLTEFDEFKSNILPALQKDIKHGMTAKEIREKYAALIQARLVTEALATRDAGKAAVIGKDIIDRVDGKAAEKKEVTHRFSDLKDEELDALLQSEESELEAMHRRFNS